VPERAAAKRARPPAPRARRAGDAGLACPFAEPVQVLFLDVDGTLTDGVIGFARDGDLRHFYVRDGIALEWARDAGVLPVVVSGRDSLAVAARMHDLGLEHHLGIRDKVATAEQVLRRVGASWERSAMIGDDLPDVPLMRRVGWPIAVADAVPEVLALAAGVTRAHAGRGAVREAVEAVLRHNRAWDAVLSRYQVP
jgi:3-deoxy-D-manno-octulosonate 8-phosphate phosphatase (KDO 8-P phosphatase)